MEDMEENMTNSVSEKMSKEKNLCFSNNNYFNDSWDFRHKIVYRNVNFDDN